MLWVRAGLLQLRDLHERLILGCKNIGVGHSGLVKLCESLNMRCIPFHHLSMNGKTVKADVFEEQLQWKKDIANIIRKECVKEFGSDIGDGTIGITVSYDGTWQKRDHTLHNGVGVLIDAFARLVLDYEVLSNTCWLCKAAQLADGKFGK